MDDSLAVNSDLRCVAMPAAFKGNPRGAERLPSIVGFCEVDVGGAVFADGPGDINGVIGIYGQLRAARRPRAFPARNA